MLGREACEDGIASRTVAADVRAVRARLLDALAFVPPAAAPDRAVFEDARLAACQCLDRAIELELRAIVEAEERDLRSIELDVQGMISQTASAQAASIHVDQASAGR